MCASADPAVHRRHGPGSCLHAVRVPRQHSSADTSRGVYGNASCTIPSLILVRAYKTRVPVTNVLDGQDRCSGRIRIDTYICMCVPVRVHVHESCSDAGAHKFVTLRALSSCVIHQTTRGHGALQALQCTSAELSAAGACEAMHLPPFRHVKIDCLCARSRHREIGITSPYAIRTHAATQHARSRSASCAGEALVGEAAGW